MITWEGKKIKQNLVKRSKLSWITHGPQKKKQRHEKKNLHGKIVLFKCLLTRNQSVTEATLIVLWKKVKQPKQNPSPRVTSSKTFFKKEQTMFLESRGSCKNCLAIFSG